MKKITVAKGDGIGPEIMDATLEIIMAAGAKIEIEEVAMVINGCEVACHNRNKIKGTDSAIETIEIYRFGSDGDLFVRYFINPPG